MLLDETEQPVALFDCLKCATVFSNQTSFSQQMHTCVNEIIVKVSSCAVVYVTKCVCVRVYDFVRACVCVYVCVPIPDFQKCVWIANND